MSKQQENARIAAAKARQPVFISGLSGQHTLETGVAYWYRGHDIYICPAGTPIHPIPFVIKKGINLVGIAPDLAPRFNPRAGDLVRESSISALKKAVDSFIKERAEDEERKKKEVAEALEQERTSSLLQIPQPTPPTTTTTRRIPSMSSLSHSLFHTPHDRAHFLSDSAPGSRLHSLTNTPYASRPVSPAHTSLRQVSSTTRLYGLMSDHHTSSLTNATEGVAGLSLSGLRRAFEGATNRDAEPMTSTAATSTAMYMASNTNARGREVQELALSPPYSRNKPIGTGRPRRASMALNQAYNNKKGLELPGLGVPQIMVQEQQEKSKNRASKCVLHGDKCDGEYVAHAYRTQHATTGAGFREKVPFVEGEVGGRVMVDWERLLREEKERGMRR